MPQKPNLIFYLGAALVSLALSLWQIANIAQINHDAVYYLQAIQGDASSIRQVGNWLFYPTLFHWIHLVSGLDLEHSAHLLNSVLDTLLVLAFIRLVEILGSTRQTLMWSAVLVLSLPYLNENRPEIIRDHGYWAFTLVAMTAYLKLFRTYSWRHLLWWYLAMITATLFRVEGVVFLALMPFGLLLDTEKPWKQRMKHTVMSLLPFLLIGLGFVLAMQFYPGFQNRLADTLTNAGSFVNIFTETIPEKARLLRQGILPQFSQSAAETTLYLGVIWSIIKDLVSSLSWLYFGILLLRRWFPAPALPRDARIIIGWYAAIAALVLFLHGAQHFVMVSRYTMSLALMLLIVVAFSLDELQKKAGKSPALKTQFAIVGVCIVLLFADSLINSSKPKVYILDAAKWARENLPDKARVLTDYHPERVGYYSNRNNDRKYEFQLYRPGKTSPEAYDYAFVRTRRGKANSELQQLLFSQGMKPIQKITGKQQGVIIYRLR
ncbi:MAG TPA: hypothetical protein EYP34_01520 [Chromatiaceae bacterium]|nr:hypothetical protein [Chromatiaceae bacterium]